jgi:large subunit ribosomal protein L28
MSRRCPITGKSTMFGHNVSHANNKTNRRFLPNMQVVTFMSDILGPVRMRVAARAVRTVEHNGGLDSFLISTADSKLSPQALVLKRRLERVVARNAS